MSQPPVPAQTVAEVAEARYRVLLEAAPDAMVIADRHGAITLVNRQAERLFGYERGELLGRPIELLVPTRSQAVHATHRVRFEAAPVARPMGAGLELAGRRKDGSEFPAEISLSPVESDGQRLVIAAVRDVTWRKEAEAERARLEARERELRAETEHLKDEFFANVSHDLRTPVAAIKAAIGVLLANEPPGLAAPLHRLLANVDLDADRLMTLVANLLELTRLQSGRVRFEPDRHDLRALACRAAQSVEPLAHARGQRVEVQLPPQPLWADVDAQRLERAILNLLSNACKYGRAGGAIRLLLAPRDGAGIFAVADDGPGVPRAERERIFERFYRSPATATPQAPGSGLGLAIARAMVELHGGRIWVESEPGAGATFFVAIPARAIPEGFDSQGPAERWPEWPVPTLHPADDAGVRRTGSTVD